MKGQIWRSANEDFHHSLKQPVLLIEGDGDKFVPIEDAVDMVKVNCCVCVCFLVKSNSLINFHILKILKYSYLAVVKNGSHMIILEQSEIVNKLIYLFLIDCFY